MASNYTLKSLIPVLAWLVLNINAGLAFTIPLKHRLWTLPAILLPAYISFKTINYLTSPQGLAGVWGYVTLLGLFHFTSLLYIKRWSLHPEKDENGKSLSHPNWLRLRSWKRVYRITSNPRLLNTSKSDVDGMKEDLSLTFASNKAPFSIWTIVKCLVGWLIQYFIISPRFPGAFMPRGLGDISSTYFRRLLLPSFHQPLQPVTRRETIIRAVLTLNSFWTVVLVLETVNTMFATFWVVVVRVGEPRDWPHLLGNPLEAYTLGRFWSRFWHRGHVSSYLDFTQLLINLLPRKLRNNKRVTTTTMHFLFFLFSGIVHSLVSWQMGDHCAYTTDIWFYLTNFAAVSIEGVVLSHFGGRESMKPNTEQGIETETGKEKEKGNTDSDKRGGRPNSKQVALMWRCIGYIWVLGFFFWAVPKFSYPKLQCAIMEQYERLTKGLFKREGSPN